MLSFIILTSEPYDRYFSQKYCAIVKDAKGSYVSKKYYSLFSRKKDLLFKEEQKRLKAKANIQANLFLSSEKTSYEKQERVRSAFAQFFLKMRGRKRLTIKSIKSNNRVFKARVKSLVLQ